MDETTYSRSLVLPRQIVTKIDVENGWEQLLPYLNGTPETNIKSLREGFVQQKNALVYTREAVLTTEKPVNLDTTNIVTDLKFVDPAGGRGTYYNAQFKAQYSFRNPTETARVMRFSFPLPTGSGTLSDFRLLVNGQEFRATDLVQGSIWQGKIPAGGTVKVAVTYRNQGARSWSYQLGGRREAIKKFDLTIHADRPAKFQRYSLFPTDQTGGGLSGMQTLRWNLSDVITAQDVSVVFTGGNIRETLGKIGLIKPFVLLLAAVFLPLWAGSRRLHLRPLTLAAALLGLSLGWALGGVLGFYLPFWVAELLGVAAALVLTGRILERPFWPALGLLAAVPLAFLTAGHASLLLVALATLALWLLVRPLLPTAPQLQ